MAILVFILILALIVLIHEFGHFIAAKKNKVLVEEFGFGFPPRLLSVKKGETVYSLNLIPLGGFVKVYGEEYQEEKNTLIKNRAFIYKKPSQKALIVFAGILMNIILGIFIYYILLSINNFKSDPIPVINNYHFKFGQQEERVLAGSIVKNSPAENAGIKYGDLFLSIKLSQNQVTNIEINTAKQLISLISQTQNQPVYLELENVQNGQHKTVKVVPVFNEKLNRPIIGVELADVMLIKYQNPQDKLFSGFLHAYNIVDFTFYTTGYLISSSFKQKNIAPLSETTSGPIGIFSLVNDTVKNSGKKLAINLMNLVALLSLSIGVINILPLPPLDGGKLAFILYEWTSGRRVNQIFEKYFSLLGFVFLVSLAIVVSINDIIKLVH